MPYDHATYYRDDYAYPCDSYVSSILNTFIARKSLELIANKYYSNDIENLYKESTPVTRKTYPSLYRIYKTCIDRLHITKELPLYVTGRLTGINALSIELRGQQMILISRQAVAQLTEDELLFVLGHELGHCQYGHIICHTVLGLINNMNKASEILGPPLTDTIAVPLAQWFQCSEFTADRAGLICCGSMQIAHDIFCQLGMSHTKADVITTYHEVDSPHPLLRTRWEMLQKYANNVKSVRYYD